MARHKKWSNEEMWAAATEWSRGGMTYRNIAGQFAKQENMKRFGLVEAPGEDTVGREIKRRLASEEAPARQHHLAIEFDPRRPEDLGHKILSGEAWQVACPRVVNADDATAEGCLARLILESGTTVIGSQGPFVLNPVDEQYTLQRETATPVNIAPGQHRSWDLVLAQRASEQTSRAVTSGPVYAVVVPADVRGKSPDEMDWSKGGACIGTPITMTCRGVLDTHLASGEYRARLEVYDKSGKRTEALFRILAPPPGGKLEVELIYVE